MKRHLKLKENQTSWLVMIILSLLVLAPLGSVLIQVVVPGVFFGNREFGEFDLLLEIFRRPLWQRALQNSLVLSISTAFLGSLIGTLLAVFRSRWNFLTAKWLDISIWLLFITPSFIVAQGWVLFSSNNGVAHQLLGSNFISTLIFNPVGLVFIMALAKFPLSYLTVLAALKWQVEDLSHAARLSGASPIRTWISIHIPLLLPAILSGMVLVFMDTIGDFGLPATISAVYRFPTLPYVIYTAVYTSPIRFDMAGALSFYLVVIIFIAIAFQFRIMKGIKYNSLTAKAIVTKQKKLVRKHWLALACNIMLLLIIIGIPLGSTLYISFVQEPALGFSLKNLTASHFVKLFSEQSLFFESLVRSIKIASIAALAGGTFSILVAYVLVFAQSKLKATIETISLLSLAVPGVVLGIGYIFFWNQKWLESIGLLLYGKFSILILAAVASAIPIITRIIAGTMATIPRTMLDVAQIQGISLLGRIYYILIPLCKSALITAALTAFGASMFDLAVNSLLFPSGQQTLPVMINKEFENFQFGYASAATILGGAIVTSIIIVINKLLNIKVRKI